MFTRIPLIGLLLCAGVGAVARAVQKADAPPHVKSLSPADVEGYLQGRGMGLAKPAELNSYPGPMHVLELAEPLKITPDQRKGVEAIFKEMRAEAMRLGKEYVEKERQLNELFTTGRADERRLDELLAESGRLHGQLRGVHLKAHLKTKPLLTAGQIESYDRLRGHTGHHAGNQHK